MSIYHWNIKIEQVEHVEVIGPMDQRNEALDHFYDKGYSCYQSGPKVDSVGAIDSTQFQLKFQKVVK